MMAKTPFEQDADPVDSSNLMLIVVGAHLRAEVADRPLAYQLCEQVQQWLDEHLDTINVNIIPVVCCDVWYINHRDLQMRPTICLGSTAVNSLSAYLSQKLNTALVRDDQIMIQLDPEFVDLRVCIWGLDQDLTIDAVELFLNRYFDGYMRAVITQVEPDPDA